jgi:hypothetical protein
VACASADDDQPPSQPTGPKGWVGPCKDWNTPAPAPKKTDVARKPVQPAKPSIAEMAQTIRAREDADFVRRLAVCDKLMEIAVRNNNQELIHQIETLEERARSTYVQHTEMLDRIAEADMKTLAAKNSQSDQNKLLDKKSSSSQVAAAKGDLP